ncbi:hypothetical protein ACOSP7_031658 [Xanthoceras sorbifolium]
MLSKPQTGETLYLYLVVSTVAVSLALIREEDGTQRVVYYISKALMNLGTRYTKVEKIVLALIISARRHRPYFEAHPITVLTNYPLRQVMQKLKASGRMIKWSVELSELDLTYKPRSTIKGQAVADFLLESIQGDAFSIDRQEDES